MTIKTKAASKRLGLDEGANSEEPGEKIDEPVGSNPRKAGYLRQGRCLENRCLTLRRTPEPRASRLARGRRSVLIINRFAREAATKPAKQERQSAKGRGDSHAVAVWQKAVDVQQHFSQIEMDIRKAALTIVLTVIGAAGYVAEKGHERAACLVTISPVGVYPARGGGLRLARVLLHGLRLVPSPASKFD